MVQLNSSPHRNTTILVIDDDAQVRDMIRARLEANSFRVVEAESGEEGLRLVNDEIDLIIVDVGLPGIDGFTVVRSVRERHGIPIIMLTGATDESDRVLGLEIGADDYVVKPFLPRELVARVQAMLRRIAQRAAPDTDGDHVIVFGDLAVDGLAMQASLDGEILALTYREFDLLHFLVRSPRQVFSRDQLLHHVWQTEPGWQDPSTVTEHVHRLRRHIEADPARPERLVTVRGVGYRFDP